MTRRTIHRVIVAVAAATLAAPLATRLHAQGASMCADNAATVLARIPAGSVVRVGAGDLVMEGTLRQSTGSQVRVAVASGEESSVPAHAVDRIWVQTGRSGGTGTRIGSITGGGLGLLLGAAGGGLWCEPGSCTRDRLVGTAVGAAVGAAAGALAGAAIGGSAPGWRRVFP